MQIRHLDMEVDANIDVDMDMHLAPSSCIHKNA